MLIQIRVWFNWIYYEPSPGRLDSKKLLSDMQRITDIARLNGLYVIVTIYPHHIQQGRQSIDNWVQADATTAKTDPNAANFWLNDGTSPAEQRSLFMNLWRVISAKFRSEPVIVAYDLMNEPYNKHYSVVPNWAKTSYPLKTLYEQVVGNLRAAGDNHIIMLDYNWVYGDDVVPLATPSKDNQVLYDIHMYYTAPENPAQGWDVTSMSQGPWNGKTPNGGDIAYTYPDSPSGHNMQAIAARFALLKNAESQGYVFFIGEFGFTVNTAYNVDVASLAKQSGFTGTSYFEYSPDESIGSISTIAPILAL